MTKKEALLRTELSVAGCDPVALVEVSRHFAELEFAERHGHERTAAQVAANEADWAAVGAAMGTVYQSLCDGEHERTMEALHAIEMIAMRHGVLVPQPKVQDATEMEVRDGE